MPVYTKGVNGFHVAGIINGIIVLNGGVARHPTSACDGSDLHRSLRCSEIPSYRRNLSIKAATV